MSTTPIQVETNAGALAVRYEQASGIYSRTIVRTLRQVERRLRQAVRARIGPGLLVESRTGRLRRSVRGTPPKVDAETQSVELRVGARTWYAAGLEEGATRQPKKASGLTVPLPMALDKRGRKLFSAREVISAPGRYGFTGTFTRNHVIFGRLLDEAVPLFALKPSITILARGYHRAASASAEGDVLALLGVAVEDGTRALTSGEEVG